MINIYVTRGGYHWTCSVEHTVLYGWDGPPVDPDPRHPQVKKHCAQEHRGQPYRLVKR